ncbi:MAG: hypothetical protein UY35_C0005G0071 [Candidatus Saccharibacteria bacterium GW2011_GWC2_48_9]|nr:MAG: hypothetical protein UY35_C0005G0071 [Candidatus Saccharibacteria bacterium GW2011_GWC2_48_9]HCH34233.1 hypothetical protein [Candidatus Saccharibacteria bacterium]
MKTNDTKLPDKSLLNRTLSQDISIYKDTSIKVPPNKDKALKIHPDIDTSIKILSDKYDYLSLRNILREEMDKAITIEQAEQIGNALTDLYLALYFDEP